MVIMPTFNIGDRVEWIDGMGFCRHGVIINDPNASMVEVAMEDASVLRVNRLILIKDESKTKREIKLQEIFENIGHIQSAIALSPELNFKERSKLGQVYRKLEEARLLMRDIE